MRFPIVMVILWVIPSTYRVLQIFDYDFFWLSFLHVFCEGINGFINTLVYAMSKKFKEELKKSLRFPGEELFLTKL